MSKYAQRLYELGLTRLREGKLIEAESAYREALSLNPGFFDAHNDLGVTMQMQGRMEESTECFRKALEIKPDYLSAYLNWGVTLTHQGRIEEALSIYQKALEIDSNYTLAYNNIGTLLQKLNRHEESAAVLQRATELDPSFGQAYFNLGICLNALRRFDEAIYAYNKALETGYSQAECYLNLGVTMTDYAALSGDPSKVDCALESYHKALKLRPCYPEAHYNTGLVFLIKRQFDHAAGSFRKAIELKPNYPEAFAHLGFALKEQDCIDDALSAYRQALSLRTTGSQASSTVNRLGALLFELDRLPVIYKDVADIARHRENFSAAINEALSLVSDSLDTLTPQDNRVLRQVLFCITNFYLAYQQMNDKDLQMRYAKLATAILTTDLNEYLKPASPSRYPSKIRLGVASEHLLNHNGAFWALGWLCNLPKEDYEFFLYSLNGMTDEVTRRFAELGTYRWLAFKEDNYLQSLQIIKEDNLDILLLPDVGMSPASRIISLTRLAPIQCVGWGHPMTSGSPNIDYYLSSELMEPPEADNHYSEKLVRLPNIGINVFCPESDFGAITRDDLNIPADKTLYGSVQSVFKHLPQFDFVYPAIAKQVPDAFFVFVGSESESVTAAFKNRLKQAFEHAGVEFDSYARVLPRLTYVKFIQVLDLLDVNLDSIGWTGGITTLNSLARNCPVVTLPGEFMRGRHSYAMLKMIGLEELIADSLDGYISLAVRMGSDKEFRHDVVEKIKNRKHNLYNDMACVDYLDKFFKSRIAEARANSPAAPSIIRQIEVTHAAGKNTFHYREASSDETVVQQVFVNQEYSLARLRLNSEIEKYTAERAAQGLRPLILDLGANIGASAVWFLQNYPLARVVAVEPDEGNYDLLVKNTKSMDCVCVKGAIASEKGFANIQDPGLGHFGLRAELDSSGSIEVFTAPELIDCYGAGPFFPLIAKIDIEGGEAELFSKNTDWIDLFPVVVVELHDWLLPGTNISRNFLRCISSRARDFIHVGENIFSIRTPIARSAPLISPLVSDNCDIISRLHHSQCHITR